MKFTLEIELGNEAMQTGEDVAKALRDTAADVQGYFFNGGGGIWSHDKIRDLNGNIVGKWEISA